MSALKLPPPVVVHGAEQRSIQGGVSSVTQLGVGAVAPAVPRESQVEAKAAAQSTTKPPAGPAPSAAQAPARAPDSPLFRHEALRAYKLGMRLSTPLKVVPLSTTLVLGTLGTALLVALAIASFGHIDLVARGRGTIRATEGVQPLRFEIEGVVRDVLVHEGDVVRAGSVLLRLDSTRLRAALIEAEEQLQAIHDRVQQEDAQARQNYARDKGLLQLRSELTRSRIASQKSTVAAQDAERARYGALAQEGLVPEKSVRETEVIAYQEARSLTALQDELARIDQQRSTLDQSLRAGITQRAHDEREATNRRDTAKLLLQQTELRAARDGRVESLVVGEGDVIEAGRVVARLVSLAKERKVSAFMPESERAFVQAGKEVRVEFDQLPVGEFGSARARVLRVSSEVASQQELERALGAAAPQGVHFAVTLEMLKDPATSALLARVGSGTLLTARMAVRRRRIIGLVFDPVRKWLD
jgi:multidrug resistance efflux pump